MLINPIFAQYADNSQDSNSIIDLMFLHTKAEEFNNHQIMLELRYPSDRALLLVLLTIKRNIF